MKVRAYMSKSWLERRLYRDHKTVEQIAAECETSKVTIYKWCKKFGINT